MTRVLARAVILALTFSGAAGIGCSSDAQHFVAVRADHTVSKPSAYPLAMDSEKVGMYAPDSKSGAGSTTTFLNIEYGSTRNAAQNS